MTSHPISMQAGVPHQHPQPQHHHHGVADSVRSLLHALARYVEARLRLFWLEGAEVLHRALVMAALAIIALVSLLATYVAVMVALVLWIARTWWQGDALPAVLIVAVGHLLVAAGCAWWIARAARSGDMFHATLSEFREDRRWLEEKKTSNT